jgi:UDP:flavonoid glycosyltransferase YjiC (YdhE family)
VVIVPHAHDQFHNALHAYRLGVAAMVGRHRLTQRRLVRALREVLDDPAKRVRAEEVGRALARENGAAVAADALEELFAGRVAQRPAVSSS